MDVLESLAQIGFAGLFGDSSVGVLGDRGHDRSVKCSQRGSLGSTIFDGFVAVVEFWEC
jgi:hypothetical protein